MTTAPPHADAVGYTYRGSVVPMRGTLVATPRQEQRT